MSRIPAIGRDWREIETPALLLNLDLALHNLSTMAAKAERMSVAVRPHFKAHKCTELAHAQIAAGAVGMTVATLAEAVALTDAGIDDILVANHLVQATQLEILSQLAEKAEVGVLVDDLANLTSIATAAQSYGSEVGVMVEIDIGMKRCGVQSHEQALQIAQLACELDGVRFEGLSAYEGHCARIQSVEERTKRTKKAIDIIGHSVESLHAAGVEVLEVSAGATSTHEITGDHPQVTEIQPGAYALMDLFKRSLVSDFRIALTVAGTVISRKGHRCVLDSGLKAVSANQATPGLASDIGKLVFVDEEHLRFDAHGSEPRVGDRIKILPGHGPLTVNLHDRIHVVCDDLVADEWPIVARR